jgi:hypothetical protein
MMNEEVVEITRSVLDTLHDTARQHAELQDFAIRMRHAFIEQMDAFNHIMAELRESRWDKQRLIEKNNRLLKKIAKLKTKTLRPLHHALHNTQDKMRNALQSSCYFVAQTQKHRGCTCLPAKPYTGTMCSNHTNRDAFGTHRISNINILFQPLLIIRGFATKNWCMRITRESRMHYRTAHRALPHPQGIRH